MTSNTFDLLGVAPELGRTFGPSDVGEGRLGLAVISYGLWQRVFGGSASVIGRSIIINGVGAGLLVWSYSRLQHIDPGFAPGQIATMTMTLPEGRYPDPARREQFYAHVLERVGQLPGVWAAGFVNVLPFSTYDRGTQITIDGHPPVEPGREPEVSYRVSSPRYHAALGARVALVNEELVRQLFGQESAMGKRG